MKTKTLFASLAVASLVVAQPVAAATRSIDSLPQNGVQSTEAADRVGSLTSESEDFRGNPILWVVLLFGGVAALIALLSDNKSPG